MTTASPPFRRPGAEGSRAFHARGLRRCRRRSRGSSRLGATVVEFAVVANVFFTVVFVCIEFARVNMIRNLTQDAAYFAARVAMVPGSTSGEAIAEADRIMGAMITNGYTVTVTPLSAESNEVSVTVSVDLDEVALFAPMFMGGAALESTATLRTERYEGFFQL